MSDLEATPPPASLPPALLDVRRLRKEYEDVVAVSDLSFSVAPGEILGLVGPNGAGKTTSLRTIAGVLPVQRGSVTVAGYDITREERRAKRALAWVPDDPQPFDAMTVHEHLEFTASLYSVKDWRARADELLELFELGPKRDALGGELSRGMRQKLAFCCAWLPRPSVVLLDEPLSGLDPRGIRSAKDAILELASEGAAVVLSSHLLDLVQQLAARFLIFSNGRAIFDGTLEEARSLASAEDSDLEELFFRMTETGEFPERQTSPGAGSEAAEPPGE